MKKLFVYMASVALMLAACNKAEMSTPVVTETITVNLNPMTKTSLDGKNTVWSKGDQVSVTVEGKNIGTLTLVEGSTFSGEVEAGYNGDAILNYPAGLTAVPETQVAVANSFANGSALLEGTTTMNDLREGNGATLQNKTALLEFSTAVSGDVVFTIGEKTYTVTGCEAGSTYYACVAPATGKLSYALGVALGANEKEIFSPAANTVYSLGELTVKKSDIGLVGSFQEGTSWDVAKPVAMECLADGWIVAKNIELFKNDEFKFVTGNSWDNPNYGTKELCVLNENEETAVVDKDSQNMMVAKNGKYNLYFNLNDKLVKVECVEEYADLTVNITINNKANWSPLYITLKAGDTVIADNASITNNKYQISGDYIGSTLTCTFSNGTKTSDAMNVAITKTGASVTLEETIIKLYFQLNTDNAKQWWGDTTKIHVWNTGTSFDTTWPGNTMTSEGNYTWSIIVPSELVDKTINFLVHNGNGWQSKDSTVTIKAEGNKVAGSSIGIN